MSDAPKTRPKRVFTAEHRRNMSEAKKGIPLSEEHRLAVSKAQKGRIFSEEHKQKLSESKKGKTLEPRSKKTIKKISETKSGVPKPDLTCPHCLKVGGGGFMYYWHFENCKYNPSRFTQK